MAEARKKRERKHSLSKTTAGPTRLQNKRQQKIVSMVDGYDSTVTISTGLRNVLLVWVLPGLAMALLGLAGILNPGGGALVQDSFSEMLFALRVGTSLLSLLTVVVSIVWAVRTWGNIRRVGKRARVGAWTVVKRHLAFFLISPFLFIGGAFLNPVFFLIGAVVLFLGMSLGPFLVLALIRLFWRSGSPPIGLEEELPHYGIVWFGSWLVYSSLTGLAEYPALSLQQASAISALTGISCIVAALTGARLVSEISRRQDDRLAAIIGSVDFDGDDDRREVTTQQIETAWASSETLVSFNGH